LRSRFGAWIIAAAAAVISPGADAAGWRGDEQGAKATALAQAFTAQADDPSAVIYNPAGLAFLEDRAFAVGFALGIASSNRFEGFDPVPGTGQDGQRRIDPESVPHAYWVEPVARRWSIGVALTRGAAGAVVLHGDATVDTLLLDPPRGKKVHRDTKRQSRDGVEALVLRLADPADAATRVAFGKPYEEYGELSVPVGIQVNHAFIDGRALGELYQRAVDIFENPERSE